MRRAQRWRRLGRALTPWGAAVITFHSLEDGLVKTRFTNLQREGAGGRTFRRCGAKHMTATEAEVAENRRARSAKLRVLEAAPPVER